MKVIVIPMTNRPPITIPTIAPIDLKKSFNHCLVGIYNYSDTILDFLELPGNKIKPRKHINYKRKIKEQEH